MDLREKNVRLNVVIGATCTSSLQRISECDKKIQDIFFINNKNKWNAKILVFLQICVQVKYMQCVIVSLKQLMHSLENICPSCIYNCLCRLQLYTDVRGHIADLDKGVCMTNVCYPSFRFSA